MSVFPALLAVACASEEPAQRTESWWVDSARVDCVGVAPMTCYRIQAGDDIKSDAWRLLYSNIKGFDYVPGQLYRIRVRISERPTPVPADASAEIYELIEVISAEPDTTLRITNLWRISRVAEHIDPRDSRDQSPLIFELNASARSYSGQLGCNRVNGKLDPLDSRAIGFAPGATTLMACENMTIESAITDALAATRRYEIIDGELRLIDESGVETLRFRPVD